MYQENEVVSYFPDDYLRLDSMEAKDEDDGSSNTQILLGSQVTEIKIYAQNSYQTADPTWKITLSELNENAPADKLNTCNHKYDKLMYDLS